MKRIYKTEKGIFRSEYTHYCSIDKFFGDKLFYYSKPSYKQVYKVASDELKAKIADRFIARNFKRKNKAEKEMIKNALINKQCDLSYFQCFYTEGSNSLSGPAYDYCKREFLKSIY